MWLHCWESDGQHGKVLVVSVRPLIGNIITYLLLIHRYSYICSNRILLCYFLLLFFPNLPSTVNVLQITTIFKPAINFKFNTPKRTCTDAHVNVRKILRSSICWKELMANCLLCHLVWPPMQHAPTVLHELSFLFLWKLFTYIVFLPLVLKLFDSFNLLFTGALPSGHYSCA